ncbi:flagellar basal-body MS-ring/collar protein FliF [Erythrobacter sp. THAF29]|uniref:flagellar basal-body MS-ring/collar protein FliF n=1 Tax=Erythrobacter sp. THAF29 TaxID=2587851 RepID=UPI0012A9B2C0|nr:flagellar basal-body MS-ring/collar protein FliF [Erythrobacter sp. THAF29]QFT76705.1 Flagellar M-ring protein [Erythrobacter sp. THAF29]
MADTTSPVPAEGTAIEPTVTAQPVSIAPDRLRDWANTFMGQPAIKRALPAIAGLAGVLVLAALYFAIASGPQRILYSNLSDGERAKVVETLERGGIGYAIDNATGVLTVSEDDLYRARMLVASDAGIAAPEGASEMLDAIPLGSSRTLEGERLRLARERELMLTIREIDGIESVRVHLATPERSVFVRDASAPTASVMVRLVSGRSLGQSQVEAIVNLVSGSVPGMTPEAVRVVDHNGRLLSSAREAELDGLLLQREFESKLHEQVTALLTPLLGEGNFSAQVQAELDHSEVTAARETYDKEGVVRSETERSATRIAGGEVGGVPGVTANTPPPDAEVVDAPPEATETAVAANTKGDSDTAIRRDYEVGREVAVTSTGPGSLTKLSVAVAVSDEALKAAAPLTAEKLQALVSAAVGANDARGDQVEVVVSAFGTTEIAPLAFYEQPWFAMALRYGTALIAVLLVLFLVVRPLMKGIRGPAVATSKGEDEASEDEAEAGSVDVDKAVSHASLQQQVELARQLAASQPDRAVEALQRMLEPPPEKAAAS